MSRCFAGLPALGMVLAMVAPLEGQVRTGEVFATFEGDGFDAWSEDGAAFGMAPVAGGAAGLPGEVQGYANESFASSAAGGVEATGTLESPEFAIEEPYISFLVGGGRAKHGVAMELVVGGEVKRSAAGQDDFLLRPRTWDVSKLKGQTAVIRLADRGGDEWGFLLTDHIVLTSYPNTKFPAATRGGKPFEPGLVATDVIPGLTIPEGASIGIFATWEDHQLHSPTALCFDEKNRMLVTETHRFRFGIPDNRDHRYWHGDDIASTSIADRRAMHEKWNHKLPVASMTEKSEMIRALEDTDGDGVADVSKVFALDFDDLLDGTAAGIFSIGGTGYFACIPNIWALRDTNDNLVADEREALFTGFGVRVSLSGHDLNGFAMGPDGRLYGTVGDRAMNITTREGEEVAYTDQGTAFRFDLDGSNFEVIHTGLRNPKEIAFDRFGNAVSVDNNSDQGDKARLVYIMEGADSGWRTDHQNLHTFHREVGYPKRPINQWMQERQWEPWHEGQPAFLLPPVTNLTSGPSGLTYHPGTGYATNCAGDFLVCDYRGGPAASGIWAFGIAPDGAGMRVVNPRKFNWGAAATDVEFGYDGALYVTDFISGWRSHEAGRVYRLTDDGTQSATAEEVASLFRDGIGSRPAEELAGLLAHPDMRVRLRAQMALAEQDGAHDHFVAATSQRENLLQRLHGVWGLWILARKHDSEEAAAALVELLGDAEAEVRAQAARALGEATLKGTATLAEALKDESARVRAFAAISLGRLGDTSRMKAVVEMLAENADKDIYLRQAGITGLVGTGDENRIAALKFHESASVRLAAVVALRRLKRDTLQNFLFDDDARVADEALRAIHDIPVETARPALAALLDRYAPGAGGRPLTRMQLRRLTHSAFRVGGAGNAARLVRVAANPELDMDERLEALRLIGTWANPHPVDQSLGRHAPLPSRNASEIVPVLTTELPALLAFKGAILAAAIQLVSEYGLEVEELGNSALLGLVRNAMASTEARVSALRLLESRAAPNLPKILEKLLDDPSDALAAEALTLMVKGGGAAALPSLQKMITSPSHARQKAAWRLLGAIPGMAVSAEIISGVRAVTAGKADPKVALEILEAAAERDEEDVKLALADYRNSLPTGDPVAPFKVALQGGDPERGREVFESHPAGQCMRCHRVEAGHTEGGEAGPNLLGIARKRDAEYFLRSLVDPGADLAAGFGVITLTLKNGGQVSGTLFAEESGHLDLQIGEDLWRVPVDEIAERSAPVSAMPPMGALLSRGEVRDLVAWLGTLKRGQPDSGPARAAKPLDLAAIEAAATAATSAAAEPAGEPVAAIDPAVMDEGRKGYALCIACHGPNGEGMPNLGPPLARSEWVLGPPENLVRIQLRGLTGPITVNGQEYNPAAPMVPQAFQTDEQIAAVLTYVRNSFGNTAPAVGPELVAKFRGEVGQPMLTVADLIPPPVAEREAETTANRPQGDGPEPRSMWVWLAPLLVLAWILICAIPYLRRGRSNG